jgi:phage-related minor tail protein
MNTQIQKDVNIKKPENFKEEFEDMKFKLDAITEMFYLLKKRFGKKNKSEELKKENNAIFNKDGIPLNSSFIGFTKNSNYPFILIIDEDGKYKVGQDEFKSLSSSAEFVSGVRRSGWTFWKLFDGRTLKEVYKVK